MVFEKIDNVKKIAVLRANALGDFIIALPALSAIKRTYPDAELVLLARAWNKIFLQSRPSPVDRVIAIPPIHGVWEEEENKQDDKTLQVFYKSMQEERFDIVVQLHGRGRHSNKVAHHVGGKLTIGAKTLDAPPLDRAIPYLFYHHELLRCLEIVSLVGARTDVLEPVVTVMDKDVEEANEILEKMIPRVSREIGRSDSWAPYVILHPGAKDPRRRWNPQCYSAIGDFLSHKGLSVFIIGVASEMDICNQVIKTMKKGAQNLCGKLSLGALTGLLAHAALFVGNDSGPLHLAQAVGAPAIGIGWCGSFVNWTGLYRAKYRPLISWRTDCPVCQTSCVLVDALQVKQECEHDVSLVDDIPVWEVQAAAEELLS